MHAEGKDGETFHLTAPETTGLREIYRGVAAEAGLPPLRGSLPRATAAPVLRARGRVKAVRNIVATQLGIPGEVLDVVELRPTFTADNATAALRGTGIAVPEFRSYAPKLWRYWAEHLDPDRARRDDPAGPLVGRHVIITGASSGIGRASAHRRRRTRRLRLRAGAQWRRARRPGRRDPRGRRSGLRIHL